MTTILHMPKLYYENRKSAITAKINIERIPSPTVSLDIKDYEPLYNCELTRETSLLNNNCYTYIKVRFR